MGAFLKLLSNAKRRPTGGLLFGHDTISQAVEKMQQREAPPRRVGPNPTTEPPLDPSMVRRLAEVERRITRKLRWHWMTVFGCWSVQMFDQVKNEWGPIAIVHHEDALDSKGRAAFKQPDGSDIEKLVYGFLEIRYATGDIDKDLELAARDRDAGANAREADKQKAMDDVLELMLTQGDAKRTAKVGQHLHYHGGDAGFKEVFQVPANAPVASKGPIVTVRR